MKKGFKIFFSILLVVLFSFLVFGCQDQLISPASNPVATEKPVKDVNLKVNAPAGITIDQMVVGYKPTSSTEAEGKKSLLGGATSLTLKVSNGTSYDVTIKMAGDDTAALQAKGYTLQADGKNIDYDSSKKVFSLKVDDSGNVIGGTQPVVTPTPIPVATPVATSTPTPTPTATKLEIRYTPVSGTDLTLSGNKPVIKHYMFDGHNWATNDLSASSSDLASIDYYDVTGNRDIVMEIWVGNSNVISNGVINGKLKINGKEVTWTSGSRFIFRLDSACNVVKPDLVKIKPNIESINRTGQYEYTINFTYDGNSDNLKEFRVYKDANLNGSNYDTFSKSSRTVTVSNIYNQSSISIVAVDSGNNLYQSNTQTVNSSGTIYSTATPTPSSSSSYTGSKYTIKFKVTLPSSSSTSLTFYNPKFSGIIACDSNTSGVYKDFGSMTMNTTTEYYYEVPGVYTGNATYYHVSILLNDKDQYAANYPSVARLYAEVSGGSVYEITKTVKNAANTGDDWGFYINSNGVITQ